VGAANGTIPSIATVTQMTGRQMADAGAVSGINALPSSNRHMQKQARRRNRQPRLPPH
jgi:hypothetical protein